MIIQRDSDITMELVMKAYSELLERIEKTVETVKKTNESQTTLNHRVAALVDSWFEGKGEINKNIPF